MPYDNKIGIAEYGMKVVASIADQLVMLYGKSFEVRNCDRRRYFSPQRAQSSLRRIIQFIEFRKAEVWIPGNNDVLAVKILDAREII
ncbi:MAG: hypothetical protein K9N07_10255 [Candidatus Cloacimonetes bacterium]|nr:hypothetical protein [Candidatus Cloacimonadota bacterium]